MSAKEKFLRERVLKSNRSIQMMSTVRDLEQAMHEKIRTQVGVTETNMIPINKN